MIRLGPRNRATDLRKALHYEGAWFETLPSVALTMTRLVGCKTLSHGEERAS